MVVVYGTRLSQTSFDMPDYQVPEDNYVPPEAPSVEEELEWDCGPLLDEFKFVLEQCKDNAKLAHELCQAKWAAMGLLGSVLERAFELCDDDKEEAEEQCVVDDKRRHALLPPACGQ